MKKIIPIFLFVLAMATSAQGGIVVLDYGSGGGADNATIESLIQQSHADNNATGAGTRTDQSVTPAGLKSTIGVLFPGINPSLTNESVVCVNATGKIGDCSNLTWDGNEMGLNGGILLGGKARIASGENYIVRIADGAHSSGLKWYHFLTDSSNYQYGYLSAGADYVKVSADSNGTGADNIDVLLGPKGTGVIGNANKSFNVDADGDVTAKSYSTTRGDVAQYIELYEATSDGDSKATIAVPAKGTGLAGDVSITVSQSLALTGTMNDGKYCTYASSGNVIACNSTPAGTGDFLADGSVPMTDGIVLADGNGDAPTTDGEMKYDRTAEKLQVGDGAATKEFVPVGVSSMITKYQYLPAAWMEDNATSPCAAAAVISGEETKARLCDDNESVIVGWQVDPEWTAGFKYRVYYGVVTNAEENDTVTWRLSGCSLGNQDALTCTAGDQVSISDELGTDDDANELEITAWSDAVTITNLAAGEWARLTLMRGTDDEATEVNLIGIEIKYQAKVSAASDY